MFDQVLYNTLILGGFSNMLYWNHIFAFQRVQHLKYPKTSTPSSLVTALAAFLATAIISGPAEAKDPLSNIINLLQALQDADRSKRKQKTIPIDPSSGRVAQTKEQSPFVVSGIRLGDQPDPNRAEFANFKCNPSTVWPHLIHCAREREDREPRGSFAVREAILFGDEHGITYASKLVRPAFWTENEVEEDIDRISKRLGTPNILINPHRDGFPDAAIATWGEITLETLDDSGIAALARGEDPQQGILVDFLNDLNFSAKNRLPIYRVSGGAGAVWIGSFDTRGQGTLRYLVANMSLIPAPLALTGATPPPLVGRSEQEFDETLRALEASQTQIRELSTKYAEAETTIRRQQERVGSLEGSLALTERTVSEQTKGIERLERSLAAAEALGKQVSSERDLYFASTIFFGVTSLLLAFTVFGVIQRKSPRHPATLQTDTPYPPTDIAYSPSVGPATMPYLLQLLSWSGRINRKEFWIFIIAISGVNFLVSSAYSYFDPLYLLNRRSQFVFMLASSPLIYLSFLMFVKRMRDRGYLAAVTSIALAAWFAAAFVSWYFLPSILQLPHAPDAGLGPMTQMYIVCAASLVALAISLWLIIECGFFPGHSTQRQEDGTAGHSERSVPATSHASSNPNSGAQPNTASDSIALQTSSESEGAIITALEYSRQAFRGLCILSAVGIGIYFFPRVRESTDNNCVAVEAIVIRLGARDLGLGAVRNPVVNFGGQMAEREAKERGSNYPQFYCAVSYSALFVEETTGMSKSIDEWKARKNIK